MKRFLDSGYADIESILSVNVPFIFLIGGRGTGKTYGALKYAVTHNRKIMLMRRTQSQADLINKQEFSPFKPIERDLAVEISVDSVNKYSSAFYLDDQCIGYSCALSTVSNLRGFDASDLDLLIYDEFIPEKHERPIKNEGSAFLNAYETMNRNRELQGKDPLQLLALANANDISNPIFMELGLIDICDKMKQKQNPVYVDKKRGVCIVMLDGSKISLQKKNTALYRLTEKSDFASMALANSFAYNSTQSIKSQNIKSYKILCGVGDIYIYKHRSDRKYYVTEYCSGKCDKYAADEVEVERFLKRWGRVLYIAYMNNSVLFESMLVKSLFEWYIM